MGLADYLYRQKLTILLILSVLIFSKAQAQEQSEAIRRTVDQLFNGMRTGDSAMVRSVFSHDCSLISVSKNANDSLIVSKSLTDAFVKAVGKPHTEIWDERIYDVKILADIPMATVWAPYKFYLGEKFSHCGVNVLTLLLTKNGWRISAITDTRRKDQCP